MKLDILTKALQHYVLSADCAETDRQHAFDAVTECMQTAERYVDRDLCKDAVYVIPALCLTDAINMIAYDDFGKLARPRGGDVPFDVFAVQARKYTALEQLTNEQLASGHGYLSDLWNDNDSYDANNPDGTLKYHDIPTQSTIEYTNKLREYLRQTVAVVKDYQMVNSDVLEQAENDRLLKLINDVHNLIG